MFEDGKRFDQLHIEATREINPHQGTMDFPVHESKTAVTFIGDVCASTIETRTHISHPPIHPPTLVPSIASSWHEVFQHLWWHLRDSTLLDVQAL